MKPHAAVPTHPPRIGDLRGAPRAMALAAGCASHRDDYGGSNDIGFTPMYGAYDGAYDGSWDWSPGTIPRGRGHRHRPRPLIRAES